MANRLLWPEGDSAPLKVEMRNGPAPADDLVHGLAGGRSLLRTPGHRLTPCCSLGPESSRPHAHPPVSALDGAGGETRDVVLHEERVDEGDRNAAEQRCRHELAPVEGVPADQLAHDAYRHGSHIRTAEEEQRVEELVLRQRKG